MGMAPSEAADSVYSDMRESFEAAARSLMSNPNLLWQTQSRLMQDQWLLWQQGVRTMAGEQVAPLITPPKNDRRFKDEAWTTKQKIIRKEKQKEETRKQRRKK